MPAERLVDRTACDGWADILERLGCADLEFSLMAEKWTPGPWRLKACQSWDGRASYNYYEVWTDDCDVIAEEVYRAHNDGGHANMRLIAAAPELAEALQEMLDEFGCTDVDCKFCSKARAALAKARGEQ